MKLAVILALFAAAPLTGAPVFRNSLPIRLPVGAAEIVAGDFNGDGHTDLLAPGTFDRKYAVYLANGTGPFAAPAVIHVPVIEPYAVAAGDLNGDGRTDVVGAGWSGVLVPALANADGSLTFGAPHATESGNPGLAIGDFNGDTLADVVSARGTKLIVSFGNGAGQFSGSAATTFGEGLAAPVPADLNGDGKLDVVARHGSSIAVFLNGGGGTFTMTAGMAGHHAVVRDFDRDGKLDVAAVANGTAEQFLEVRRGNGDGTLGPAVRYASGYWPETVAAADVDADGNVDLLISAVLCGGVSVLRGRADGTFHPLELLFTGVARTVVAADFDRDQKIDLAGVVFEGGPESLLFVRGNGDGTFGAYRGFHANPAVPVPYEGLRMRNSAVAELNGDGKPDVVVVQSRQESPHRVDLAVLLNDGTGSLAAPITTATAIDGFPYGPKLAAGDVDNDGKQDVVVVSPFSGSFTFRGLGNGQFAAPVPLPSVSLRDAPFLGHFNADANLDLFVSEGYTSAVHPGNGDGTFGAAITGLAAYNPVAGDLNGDGRLDYVSFFPHPVFAAINDGSGHFTPVEVTADDAESGTLADFNGDTKLDLLLVTTIGTQMRFGNGDGTFAAPIDFLMTPKPGDVHNAPVTAADFDGDGKVDFAAGASVYLSNGDGTFRSRSRYRAQLDSAHVADMDGNGTPDLVGVHGSGDDVVVLPTRTAADPTRTSTLTLSNDRGAAPQYAEAVTFTAAVEGDGAVKLTGVVRFTIDGEETALIAVDDNGIAAYTARFGLGAHDVTATYTGDEHYVTSSDTDHVAVTRAETQLFIQGTPNPATKNRRVTIFVTRIAQGATGLPGPTGAIALRDGDTPLGVEVVDGAAQLSTLAVGTHVITAEYAGDEHYLPSSASYTQTITKPRPTLFLELPPSPVFSGQTVTLRAYFAPGAVPVTGTITFSLADRTAIGTVSIVQGSATIQAAFPWGGYTVVAAYSGDETWATSGAAASMDVYSGHWGTAPAIEARGDVNGGFSLRWSHIVGAASYRVWRKNTLASPWVLHGTYGSGYFGTYDYLGIFTSRLFAVTAIDLHGNVSPMSVPDLATAVTFNDDLIPGATPIRAQHIAELRTAIGYARTFAGLPAFNYTNAITVGAPVRAADLTELRTALGQAYSAIGLPAMQVADPVPSIVRAAHFLEIRSAVN